MERWRGYLPSRWKILINKIKDIEKEIEGMENKEDVDYRLHWVGNILVKIKTSYVNLWKFRDGTIPTHEGLSLKCRQWQHMIG